MSHFRDLFHKPPGHDSSPSASLKVPVAEDPGRKPVAENPGNAVHAATATQVLPDFPVEEIQLRAENRLVYHTDPRGPAADRFRLLRMRLKMFWKAGKLKKLLITGPLPHDGKSTVLLNLATALAERGKRTVLVVEADLHHSGLTPMLRLRPWVGLTECLVDDAMSPLTAIRRIDPLGWYLLPAGEPRRNPTELLQTPAFGQIMEQLTPNFDWILIDSPPVVPLTDSISLQQHADASLLVVRADRTPREAVEQTIELLGKKNILGVVLNGVEMRDRQYYQYYDAAESHADD